jgi:predicted phosphoribosyltransferase
MSLPFQDRSDAGRQLAAQLTAYRDRPDVLVLALPRGGVPVAYEVARALGAPLDLIIVRKLGLPGHEELAMGAVSSNGVPVLNDEVVDAFEISPETIARTAGLERQEIERMDKTYRGGRPAPDVRGRTVIVVDDGLATGSTMRAAVRALRQQQPARIVVAVPVAALATCEQLKHDVDEIVCTETPANFYAVGLWYADFAQVSDEQLCELLERARNPHPAASGNY